MTLQDKAEFVIFNGLVKFFGSLGLKKARKATAPLAFLLYYIIPLRKAVVIKNLKIAFPGKSEKEIKRIAYANYRSLLITFVEIACLPGLTRKEIAEIIHYENLEILEKKLSENKGLLLLTAHFGNWEYAAATLGIQLGRSIHVLAKNQRNMAVTKWLNYTRSVFGNKVVPLGVSVKDIYIALKEKRIVGVVGDQRGPSDGLRVDFFGRPTSTYTGTASISHKLKTPAAMVFVARQKDFSYKGYIEEVDTEALLKLDQETAVKEFNTIYMKTLEKYIGMYPEQWFWMHNIWKY